MESRRHKTNLHGFLASVFGLENFRPSVDFLEATHLHVDWLGLDNQIAAVFHNLPEREVQIVQMRFGLDDGLLRDLDEIGSQFGVTRERTRQIENKSMAKIKHASRSGGLKPFLIPEHS